MFICFVMANKGCFCVVRLPVCFKPDTSPHVSDWWRIVPIVPFRIAIEYCFGVCNLRYIGHTQAIWTSKARPPNHKLQYYFYFINQTVYGTPPPPMEMNECIYGACAF